MPPSSSSGYKHSNRIVWLVCVGLLAIILSLLFYRSFNPDFVHFFNDGPLGQQNVAWSRLPSGFGGDWDDLNILGDNAGAATPGITALLSWSLGPVGVAKFLIPISLFVLGLGAWTFFRALKLSPLAATLGALAAMLNSTFLADACWGLPPHEIALGMIFFALALVVSNQRDTPWLIRWIRLALAGLCVGVNVMEAADIGALYSLIVAAFIFYKAWTDGEGGGVKKVFRGISRVAVVAVFAGFIAIQTILSLVGTQIQGVAGASQDTETKSQHWDWATQWSLPKKETLGIIVPGLFGYKMDTPKDMMPAFQDSYRGGVYWGGVGRDPTIDRQLDAGEKGTPSGGFMRFSGGGYYCGILVLLIAIWGSAQSFRRKNSPFTDGQKKIIWFWLFVAAVCLPLGWGRFAPGSHSSGDALFYALLYKLPYFSTIRNPIKFLIFFSWAVVILFAYGMHALNRHIGNATPKNASSLSGQVKSWWAKAGNFDRKWTQVCGGLLGVSLISWLIYFGQKTSLIQYLQAMGFPDANTAGEIATFSISQAGWFVLLFAVALALVTLVIAGYFNGPRAKIGGFLLGGFLLFDLGRADLPYVVHWDYKQKYEINTLNPIVAFLAQKPYEHRVAKLLPAPLSTPSQFELFDQLYGIEWTQHFFPYYDIQCLDIIQMSRMPEDLLKYTTALRIGIKQDASGQWMLDQSTFPLLTRKWELTNTRYLLGPAAFLDLFNSQFDPGKSRFRIVQRFDVAPKPGIVQPTRLEELTAVPNDNGQYALFDFTGALPRAKLYANWQVNTNDESVLKTLADLNFDPAKTVLISTPQKNLPAISTNEAGAGTVEFKSYASKKLVFTVNAAAPSVLLLNDKYNPNWHVTVDGQPAELLRCNFMVRGVQVSPGAHEVEFTFDLPRKSLYVTLSAISTGILLCVFLVVLTRRKTGTDA